MESGPVLSFDFGFGWWVRYFEEIRDSAKLSPLFSRQG